MQVQLKRRGDNEKYTARVLAIGTECDVALLTGVCGCGWVRGCRGVAGADRQMMVGGQACGCRQAGPALSLLKTNTCPPAEPTCLSTRPP